MKYQELQKETIKDQHDIEDENISDENVSDYEDFKSTEFNTLQKKAIKNYKNWGSDDINSYLRFGTSTTKETKIIDSIVETIDSCFKHQTDKICYVLRIVERKDIKPEYVENAYLSTSTSKEYIEENLDNFEDPIIMRIEVPPGIKYVKPLIDWTDFEQEIIFQRGLFLKIKSDVNESNFVEYQIIT